MSRSNRHKEKLEIKNEINPDNSNEETAARTRPFSFDEIMLRRKKKKADILTKPVEAENLTKEVSKEKAPDTSQSSKPYRNTKLSSIVVAKDSSEDIRNAKSRDIDDNMDNDRIMKRIGRDNRDRVIRSKPMMNRTVTDIRRNQWSRNHGNNRNEFERRSSRHVVDREIYADRSRGRSVKIFDRKPRNYDEERKNDREIERKQRNDNADRRIEPKSVKNFDKKPRKDDEGKNSERDYKRKQRNGDEVEGIRQNSMKKLDSGKRQDQEASEKKDHVHMERKESLHNEARKKHSRSRDRDKNSGRRSTSLSPRSHRRVSSNDDKRDKMSKNDERNKTSINEDERNKTSKNGDERNKMSKIEEERKRISKNDDERKKISKNDDERNKISKIDDERNMISRNGSSGRYRRRGESPSGLGGYSPRKRRTIAAVKTPSPPHLSPENKTAGWDLPPPPAENTNSTLPILPNVISNTHELPSIVPVISMPVRGIHGVFSYASVDSVQLTQATRPMRRLYVENLPDSASEKTVMEWLNNFLLSSGVNRVPGSQPCISCSIHKEKGQALVEFLTPEDASAALYFDGRYLSGSALKIRRPKDYTEVATGVADKSLVSMDASNNFVRDSPNKIFIGGVPKVISSEMLREIAASFGPIKAFHFKANVDLDGPCAFLEYTDESVTLKACAGLNAMRLGGQLLTVVQATPDASSVEIFGNPPFYGIPEHSKPLLQKPTQVLKLKNALHPDGLSSLSEQELEEMLEDIRLECARFGTVNSVNFVKYRNSDSMPDSIGSAKIESIPSKKSMKSEHLGKHIDGESQESSMLEVSRGNSNQIEEEDNFFKDEGTNGEDNTANNIASCNNIEKVVNELAFENNPSLTSVDLDPNGNKIDENIKTLDAKRESEAIMVEQILKTDAISAEAAFIDSSEAKNDESGERVFKFEDPFETGSILVEYKRIEASSIAAHYLHGRLFDDRTVTVEYVDYDVYRDRFLK